MKLDFYCRGDSLLRLEIKNFTKESRDRCRLSQNCYMCSLPHVRMAMKWASNE